MAPPDPAQYQVRLLDTSGSQVAVFDNPNSVYYFKRTNDFSYHTISIPLSDPRYKLFTTDAIVEVWRRIPGGIWYVEYAGFHRTDQAQFTDPGSQNYTSYGRGYEDLLHRRSILYYSGTAGASKSGTVDDVAKAYVRENVGSLATVVNGRIQSGVISGFTVAANVSLGPAIHSRTCCPCYNRWWQPSRSTSM
jgi:hypothetical protein